MLACAFAMLLVPGAGSANLPAGFHETVVLDGLIDPTAVKFARDGQVFVAEKSGRILVFSSLHDPTPSVFADLSTNVHNFWDRGLLGLELHPEFPDTPYVYVSYTYDAAIGGLAPSWGLAGVLSDPCPTPPGPTTDGCVVSGRLSRLEAAGDAMTSPEHVLLEDWCQQYPSHSIGDLEFGPDGALYVGGGDGASFGWADYGQAGDPPNPCGDPPAGVGGAQEPPDAEGGALRSQDLRTMSDPVGLDGTILRLDPATGQAMPGNPFAFSPDANARRVIAYGLRNPFRFTIRPGTSEIWIGDVGSGAFEEVNRIVDPDDAVVENFGWPCYEGTGRLEMYEDVGLSLCSGLYGSPGAVTRPFYSYRHDPDADVDCPTGTAAIAGIDFYEGGTYPGYDGALFFTDFAAECIWVIRPGGSGVLDPAAIETFASAVPSPVDLEVGPGGDLFYADIWGGAIRRISHESGNVAPTAEIAADPTTGASPLAVQFDGSRSHDPNLLDVITYAWDLDDDGEFDDSTDPSPSYVYGRSGTYTARLRVTDSYGETGTAALVISVANSPPRAAIALPTPATSWKVGDTIAFSGSAADADDGELPASRLSWTLVLEHCPAACHSHVLQRFEGTASGSFTAPDHEYPSHLELRVTATDSGGLADTETVMLDPQTVQLHVEAIPTGLQVVLGTAAETTPFSRTVIVGSRNTITAPSPQPLHGLTFLFDRWSDGGTRSHEIVAPLGAATYTASFSAPPVASDDAYAVDEDGRLTLAGPGVLGNDSDGDTPALTAVLDETTTKGVLALSPNGSVTYTPGANFNGTDTFTYRASDGTRDSNLATVTIAVKPVNDPPVAASDSYSMKQFAVLEVAAPGVLGNDSDIDGSALRAAKLDDPAGGTLGLNADGSFTYTPNANTVGTVSFTYRANDGALDSNVARVVIDVARVARPLQRVRCVVPKLVGRTLVSARQSLLRAHCGLGRVFRAYSRAASGLVLSQNPRAGRRLQNLAKVAVVVSRGRRR